MSNRNCFELAVKTITASAITGFVIQIFGGRERRFGQAACLTIAQRFGRSSALPPRSGLERSDFVLWHIATGRSISPIGSGADVLALRERPQAST